MVILFLLARVIFNDIFVFEFFFQVKKMHINVKIRKHALGSAGGSLSQGALSCFSIIIEFRPFAGVRARTGTFTLRFSALKG